jgi:acetyl-CoA/propionyl-CoA carboxylase carboxyl transferase subunit
MIKTSRERYQAKLKRLGQWSFQERLEALFDSGSCELINAADWDAAWELAVITARGTVHGRPVCAYASHFLVADGTIGVAEADAISDLLASAAEAGMPVVALLQSNGARVDERQAALPANARMFMHVTRLSGVVPQLTACLGLCLGVAAYLASLADFAWMVPGKGFAATTSPAVIKVATGRSCSLEELGGAAMHAGTSGVASLLADDDAACIAQIRQMLDLLAGTPAPAQPPTGNDPAAVVPASPFVPYDVHALIDALVDGDSFLEVHARWGQSLVTGLARLDGRPVGIVANQSNVRSGVLDTTAARKASRFVQCMDAHGLPLLYLVDVPGIMVSPDEEQDGILSAGALLFHAVDTDVPRVSLVVRKCFGGAFVMLQARQADGDRVLALPGAQIDIAGTQATFAILHGKTFQTHPEAEAFRQQAMAEIKATSAGVETALAAGIVDQVVAPTAARAALIQELQALAGIRPRRRYARRHPIWPV